MSAVKWWLSGWMIIAAQVLNAAESPAPVGGGRGRSESVVSGDSASPDAIDAESRPVAPVSPLAAGLAAAEIAAHVRDVPDVVYVNRLANEEREAATRDLIAAVQLTWDKDKHDFAPRTIDLAAVRRALAAHADENAPGFVDSMGRLVVLPRYRGERDPSRSPAFPRRLTPLEWLIRNTDPSALLAMQLLLAAGADPNHTWDPKKTLLSVAVEAANLAAVRLLLQAGAAVKAHLPSVLYYPIARLAGNSKQKAQFRRQYLELLLHERPDLLRYSYNASSECLLDYLDHFIGYCPEVAVLKWLLQQGADVNTQQAAGNTPLHLLILSLIKSLYDDDAYELWLPAIRVLMQAGANPKITNAAGQSVYELIRSNAAAFTATQLQQLRLILDKQEHLLHGPYPWEQHKYPAIKKQLAVERAELAAVAAAARAVAATTAHAADGAAETKED